MINAQSSLAHAGLAAFALAAPSAAQTAPASPCTDSAIHRAFDFWVGEWNVYAPDGGAYQGKNTITIQPGGCMLWEHWEGASGSVGNSMNFFDPLAETPSGEDGAWRQVWVNAPVVIDYTGGLEADGSMLLTGEIFYQTNGQRFDFRGRWTPHEDGTLTQHFEQADAQGEWADWFIGHYVRIEDDPRAQEAAAARGE